MREERFIFSVSHVESNNPQLPSASPSLLSETKEQISLKQAIKDLALDTLPTFCYYGSTVLINAFNLYFAGLSGDPDLTSAVGLSNTWVSATSIYLIIGLNIGNSAICSQAVGAKQYYLAGLALHRALITRLLIAIATYPLLFFSEDIFRLFGVEDNIAKDAGLLCKLQFGVVLSYVFYDTLKSLLMAYNLYTPFIFIQIAGTAAHWGFLVLFINRLDLGIVGFCAALTSSYCLMLVLLLAYILIKKPCKESLFCFTGKSFKHLFSQIKQEVPIGAVIYLDFAAFEVAVLFSGSYPPVELASQILMYNVMVIMTLFPLSLNTVLTTYLGNAIGESNVKRTRTYIKAGIILGIVFIVVEAPSLFFLSDDFARIFTSDQQVIDITRGIEKIYSIVTIADFTQLIMTSILRGIGKEALSCIIFATGYYLLGLPLAFVLGNVRKGYARGLWYGIITGIVFNGIVTTIAVCRVDVHKQATIIARRIEENKEKLSIVE